MLFLNEIRANFSNLKYWLNSKYMRANRVLKTVTTAFIVGVTANYFYKRIVNKKYIRTNIKEVLKKCKTGDIIYFRTQGADLLHSVVSYFTHIGMILRDPITDEVHIVETHAKGDTDHMGYHGVSGINLYNLEERIKQYAGTVYFGKLCIQVDEINEKIKECIEKCMNIPYDHDNRNHYINTCMLCIPTIRQETEQMFCSEFIGYILRYLNLISSDVNISCFSPTSFVGMKSESNELIFDEPKIICVTEE